MRIFRSIIFAAVTFAPMIQFTCMPTHHGHTHADAQAYMHSSEFEALVARFEDPERAAWQHPDAVVNLLAKTAGGLKGRVVADLGAGTGYFSFRIARNGADVLALDLDERFLAFIENRKKESQYTGVANRVRTVRVQADAIGLGPASVDVIFSVNVYHHIDARVAYFRDARRALRPGGFLFLIDFKSGETPVGPPAHLKLSQSTILAELKEAGYRVELNERLLPYQTIFIARP